MILSYLRTLFLYLVLIFAVRLMGKRQIGEMEPAEFVVTMLVANLAAIPMQDGAIPLYSGLVPILTVLGLELVLSGAILRSVRLRQLLCGKPVILIDNGKILQDNLRNARVTLDELTGHLREKDVLDIQTVHSGDQRQSVRVPLPQGKAGVGEGRGGAGGEAVPAGDHSGRRLPVQREPEAGGKGRNLAANDSVTAQFGYYVNLSADGGRF